MSDKKGVDSDLFHHLVEETVCFSQVGRRPLGDDLIEVDNEYRVSDWLSSFSSLELLNMLQDRPVDGDVVPSPISDQKKTQKCHCVKDLHCKHSKGVCEKGDVDVHLRQKRRVHEAVNSEIAFLCTRCQVPHLSVYKCKRIRKKDLPYSTIHDFTDARVQPVGCGYCAQPPHSCDCDGSFFLQYDSVPAQEVLEERYGDCEEYVGSILTRCGRCYDAFCLHEHSKCNKCGLFTKELILSGKKVCACGPLLNAPDKSYADRRDRVYRHMLKSVNLKEVWRVIHFPERCHPKEWLIGDDFDYFVHPKLDLNQRRACYYYQFREWKRRGKSKV